MSGFRDFKRLQEWWTQWNEDDQWWQNHGWSKNPIEEFGHSQSQHRSVPSWQVEGDETRSHLNVSLRWDISNPVALFNAHEHANHDLPDGNPVSVGPPNGAVPLPHAFLNVLTNFAGAGGPSHDGFGSNIKWLQDEMSFRPGHNETPEAKGAWAATTPTNSGGLQLVTDQADYAPGSIATFTLSGVNPGATAQFEVSDLPQTPGLNGIVDTYATFIVTDGAVGDADGKVDGTITTTWQVPDDGSATLATLRVAATADGQTAEAFFTDANRIALENQKPGTAESYWNVSQSEFIEGFTTQMSVNAGATVDFKINVAGVQSDSLPYIVEIFRLGYYGGDGATLVTSFTNADGTVQPDALYDASLGLVDAGNWSITDSWSVPTDAVSGVYLARLQRVDANGDAIADAVNQIPFIVRNDGAAADIVLQTSDTTWQAYNAWGGNNSQLGASFYQDASGLINHDPVADPGLGQQDRAYALSYNRPFLTTDSPYGGAHDYLFGADFAAIYWLEQNGYDVTYISGVDADRLGTSWFEDEQGNILRDAYISVGHDEYWSGNQRANVEAARDAGVNLLFWSGNEVYWRTRYEDSIDGSADAYRTLVSYKETWANGTIDALTANYANIDPSNEWTGTWRDLRFVDAVDSNGNLIAFGAEPETSLTGQLFAPDGTLEFGGSLDIPLEYTDLRYWRDTSVENSSGVFNLAPGIIGYEWDVVPNDEYRPAGLIKLSETTIPWSGIVYDQGNREVPDTATHNFTLYRAESGALVFAAGTTFYTWGLSDRHESSPYGANIEDPILQQFTVNLFADMGILPVTLQQGLTLATASTDTVAATATITNLPQQFDSLDVFTFTGTATDDDGNPNTTDGTVALVEISFDGGATWRPADGTTNWSYDWIATPGTHDIVVRAIDDSLNLPDPVDLSVNTRVVGADRTFSLFDPSQYHYESQVGYVNYDQNPLELGVTFQATEDGFIKGLRYFRSLFDSWDTDSRQGTLWSADGTALGTVTFVSDPGDTGWQTATFSTPISIQAGNFYVASYHADDWYMAKSNFFDSTFEGDFGTLSAPAGGGVFQYGAASVFPTLSTLNQNFWVDVVFDIASQIADNDPAANSVLENASSGTPVGITAASDVSGATYALSSNPGGLFAIDPSTGVVTVANGANIDREALGPVQTIVVEASTSEGAGQRSFDIAIGDVNEYAVSNITDVNQTTNGAFLQAPIGYEIGLTALATDLDATNNVVTYSLSDNAGGRFAINPTTGVVTVASLLDTLTTYQITVEAASQDGSFATPQTFDVAVSGSPQFVSLFDPMQSATGTAYQDSPLELGVQFQTTSDGAIAGLRYYRSASDAADTDVRIGTLWDSNGNALGSVTFNSAPGQTGWQTANFANPVITQADVLYTASYHSNDYYFAQQGFYSTPYSGIFGTISAPVSAGVYNYGVSSIFPTLSYNDGNYWVDVVFEAYGDLTDNDPSANSINENAVVGTLVGITALSADQGATYSLSSNPGGLFAIDPVSGVVTVAGAIDRETVGETQTIVVKASTDLSTSQGSFVINIGDVNEFNVSSPADADLEDNNVFLQAPTGLSAGITALATDSDATNNAVTYSLTDNAGGIFDIDPVTGVVTVGDGSQLNTLTTHQIEITATSVDGSTSSQTFTIDVTEAPRVVDLFNSQPVTGTSYNDGTSLELGVRFEAAESGEITALRYYRSATDSGDTDVRTGTLWDANANALGTVTFTSAPGQDGWQTATFSSPIEIQAGMVYTASYHTEDNYIALGNYFDSQFSGALGTLTAPVSAGVYQYASTSVFPTSSYNDANYWVDLVFQKFGDLSDSDTNANIVAENAAAGTIVGVTALSADVGATYSLSSNPVNDLFVIDPSTGVVTVAAGSVIDRETLGASVAVEVTATSSAGTSKGFFDINIDDVNEFDVSSIVDSNQSDDIVSALATAGTQVGITATATDLDATNNAVTFGLIDDAGGLFSIDEVTGIVTVANGAVLNGATTHQIVVEATSQDLSTSTQAFDISVTAPTISLFDPTQAVQAASANDSASIELGVRFQSDTDGSITAIKYYRGTADSGDNDIRDGNLWDANGNLLASVTFDSSPGESGWQTAILDNPVAISADTIYIASYHTEDNYVAQGGFFASQYDSPDGTLTAPAANNGVYVYGTGSNFPDSTYGDTNYWVDVVFTPQEWLV